MCRARVFIRLFAIGTAFVALSCTVAVADRWDNNNRRSDQSGQSGRSFRGGSTASHNFSNAQPSSQSFGSGSRRVVQGQSEGSSSHSYNSGSPSGAVSRQAFGVQSRRGGSDDNATAALPTLGGQGSMHFFDGAARNRNHGLETPYSRGWSRQTTAFGAADQRTLQRSSDNTSDSSQAGTTTFDWRTGNHNSSSSSDRSAQTQRGNDSSRGDGQWQWRGKQLRSQDTAAPVTNDKVRDFLQLRRDGSVNQAGVESGPGFNRQFSRSGNPSSLSRVTNDELRRFKMNDQMNEARADGDRAWTKQFGNKQGSVGESSRHRSAGKPFVGKNGTGFGNATADGKNSFGNEHKFDQASLNRTYNDWRKNAVGGGRHASADQRDWSGRWKDGNRFVAAKNIRDHWQNHADRKNLPFSGDWWRRNGRDDGHFRDWDRFAHRHRPGYWWNWCSVPRLSTWFSFGWPSYYYWDYGPGEYINCHNGVVYVNGAWFEPAPLYYERTLLLVQNVPVVPPVQAPQVEWLPLGVFAVARDGVADRNVLIQLAVARDGTIGGTIFNQLTGATYDVQGTIDKDTQRAVWTYFDDTGARIIMETSIFNLTQPEATGLIHYGPDNIQVIELVRLEAPNAVP